MEERGGRMDEDEGGVTRATALFVCMYIYGRSVSAGKLLRFITLVSVDVVVLSCTRSRELIYRVSVRARWPVSGRDARE